MTNTSASEAEGVFYFLKVDVRMIDSRRGGKGLRGRGVEYGVVLGDRVVLNAGLVMSGGILWLSLIVCCLCEDEMIAIIDEAPRLRVGAGVGAEPLYADFLSRTYFELRDDENFGKRRRAIGVIPPEVEADVLIVGIGCAVDEEKVGVMGMP